MNVHEKTRLKGYYYCSIPTFLNILTNKSIYLSDPLKMNDTEEIRWLLNLLEKADTEKLCNKYNPELAPIIEKVRLSIRKMIEDYGQDNLYVACFSKDADMLSQWRGYGDDGKGVSIGFDLGKIVQRNYELGLAVQEIEYMDHLDENVLEFIIEYISAIDVYSQYFTEENKNRLLMDMCSWIMARYKNPAFKEENEIRLLYSKGIRFEENENETGEKEIGIIISDDKVHLESDFRLKGTSDLIQYVELNIEPLEFVDIYLGPKCELSEQYAKRIVRKKLERDIVIQHSRATYR